MQKTTMNDRRRELQSLLNQFRDHPERDWSQERQRAHVLSEMLAKETGPRS